MLIESFFTRYGSSQDSPLNAPLFRGETAKHLKRPFAMLMLVFVLANGATVGEGVIYPRITPLQPPPTTYAAARRGSTNPGEELKSEDATVD